MKKAPTKFNKKMKEAAAAGELDKNPKFKKAVMDSPAMLKKSMAKLKKSMAQLKKVNGYAEEKISYDDEENVISC
jgi:3-oxoacyl-[acyl-carrier-protein] synthase III